MNVPLLLQALDYQGPGRWRWVLSSGNGRRLTRHEVRLDTGCWQYEALTDLPRYLSWHTAPDRWEADEERILTDLGNWAGQQVLGPVSEEIAGLRPATVLITVPSRPEEARQLLYLPLELARVGGRPLGLSRISLVRQTAAAHEAPRLIADRLRVLGLFSLPEGSHPLNLRRERQALVRTIARCAAMGGNAEIRVLQYGATRETLRQVLDEPYGWDIVHISGHGEPGELLLETADGAPDPIPPAVLAELLSVARPGPRLVTLSACWSAAPVVAGQRLLATASPADLLLGSDPALSNAGTASGAMAAELSERLDCAVLAMRYAVADEFATDFFEGFYQRLLRKEQPLPEVLNLVLHELGGRRRDPAMSALSTFSPVLFGSAAAELTLRVPERSRSGLTFDAAGLKMAGFPSPPDRFVGRTGIMARVSADLAPASGVPGILLHGMPGAGKTACALELAYAHEHAFSRLIWFTAPDEGQDIHGALASFALALEQELAGLEMLRWMADEGSLRAFLPRLSEFLEQARILIVLDNMESLLSEHGDWRDERWNWVVRALCGHAGVGRVVLTSRRLPRNVPQLRVETVDALSPDESFLLALELPHLRALIRGEWPQIEPDAARRRLVRGVLNAAHGHPKLLELADAHAVDIGRLEELIQAGDRAWPVVDALASGESPAFIADYLQSLDAWTTSVSAALAPGDRTLLWFLCCLAEGDRIRPVVADTWPTLWHRLGMADAPPSLTESLRVLNDNGLLTVISETAGAAESYAIHPGVAAAGNAQSGSDFQEAVDREITSYWMTVMRIAADRETEAGTSTLVARAGLAVAPHLIRLGEWQTATAALEEAFIRDRSAAAAAAVLPVVGSIVDRGAEPRAVFVLARVLEVTDPPQAERTMRAFHDMATAQGDIRAASLAAGCLSDHCLAAGRLAEALHLADVTVDLVRQARLGPWTQLACLARRLQVLSATGEPRRVLAEADELRAYMGGLPDPPVDAETVIPWNIRETVLDIGRNSAVQLGLWDHALDLNRAIAESQRRRGAPPTAVVRTAFTDYYSLIAFERYDEALQLLLACRRTMQEAYDITGLGRVISALADLEDARNRGEPAIGLERDALRYKYLAGDVLSIAISHNNLGDYLRRHARQPATALGHHLAAALISALTGAVGSVARAVYWAGTDLRELGPGCAVPADITELCKAVADVPGTDFAQLLAALSPDYEQSARELRQLITRAEEIAAELHSGHSAAAEASASGNGDTLAVSEPDTPPTGHQDSADTSPLTSAVGHAFSVRVASLLGALSTVEIAQRIRQARPVMSKDFDPSPLSMVVGRILGGELDLRKPDLGGRLAEDAIAATWLTYIPADEARAEQL